MIRNKTVSLLLHVRSQIIGGGNISQGYLTNGKEGY
jgi:hypothetical protein